MRTRRRTATKLIASDAIHRPRIAQSDNVGIGEVEITLTHRHQTGKTLSTSAMRKRTVCPANCVTSALMLVYPETAGSPTWVC